MQLKKHKTLRSLLTEWINHYVITPGLHSDMKAEGLKLVQLWVPLGHSSHIVLHRVTFEKKKSGET